MRAAPAKPARPIDPAKVGRQLLAAVKRANCSVNTVRRLLPHCTKAEIAKSMLAAAARGQLAAVEEIVAFCGPGFDAGDALGLAAQSGYLEVVRALIPVSDPGAYDSAALRAAAANGHLDVVRLLLPLSDPRGDDSDALRVAAKYGYLNIVKELLPVCDLRARDSDALRSAAANGHLEIVRLLIPFSEPKTCESNALRDAATNGHRDVMRLLAPVSDISVLLQILLTSILTFRNGTAPFALLDELSSFLDDSEMEKAYAGLTDGFLSLMPNISAWHTSRELKIVLHAISPSAAPASTHRRSL